MTNGCQILSIFIFMSDLLDLKLNKEDILCLLKNNQILLIKFKKNDR